jgi:hypothetical protein
VPWARRSRSPWVAALRDAAKEGFALKQRAVARLTRVTHWPVPVALPDGDRNASTG